MSVSLFDQFIRERRYLLNVSPATVDWYTHSLSWLPSEQPTQEQLNDVVMRLRERGRKVTGINCVVRAINVYLRWSAERTGLKRLKIAQLKEPELVLPTFSAAQITALVKWRPKTFYQRRLHLAILVLLDTGCRIDEVLSLTVGECDCDNLLLTVTGKGRKQRRIPFSFELRRVLARFVVDHALTEPDLLLATRKGRKLGRRIVLRDVKQLCRDLGFEPPARTLHCFRHTFSLNYLRRGGSVFHLQKTLGHASLEMTRRYTNLVTEDLQAIHAKISLLSR